MEEKNNGRKEVTGPRLQETTQKMSYEKLNDACAQLSQQNREMQAYIQKLHKEMQLMQEALTSRRMDYLFKVLEAHAIINDPKFVKECVEEIREALIAPEEDTEKNKDN